MLGLDFNAAFVRGALLVGALVVMSIAIGFLWDAVRRWWTK